MQNISITEISKRLYEEPMSLNNKHAIDRQKNQIVNIQIMMAHFQLINGLKNILPAVQVIHILTVDSNNKQTRTITIRTYSYTKHKSNRYKITYSGDNSSVNIFNKDEDIINATLHNDDSTDIDEFKCLNVLL